MHPRELLPSLAQEEAKDLFIEMVHENRALRLTLVKYVERFGIPSEWHTPEPPAEPDIPDVVLTDAPESEPSGEEVAADGDAGPGE